MRISNTGIHIIAVLLTVWIALVGLTGCDGSSGPGNLPEDNNYRLGGVIIKDPDIDSTNIIVRLARNDTNFTAGIIIANSDTLTASGDVYRHTEPHTDTIASILADIIVVDTPRFNDTVITIIPADFRIDTSETVPPIRQKFASERVRLSWFGAAGTNGYIIAAVKKDNVYTGSGYSQYVTTGATSATFNDSAFTKYTLQGEEPDTGMYYLYVYAYSGSPDSVLSATVLPVPLPDQLSDNISDSHFNGRVGSVVVTVHDSMQVVAE